MSDDSEYDKAARDLEWQTLVDRIASGGVGDAACARLRALRPATTPDEARRLAQLTRDAEELLAEGAPLPVVALPDVAELIERLERGAVGTGPEFRDLRRVLDGAKTLRAFLGAHGEGHPDLVRALETPASLDKLGAEIAFAIDDDGDVMDRASPELARARKKASDTRRELTARLGDLMNRYADVLRDKFYTENFLRIFPDARARTPASAGRAGAEAH